MLAGGLPPNWGPTTAPTCAHVPGVHLRRDEDGGEGEHGGTARLHQLPPDAVGPHDTGGAEDGFEGDKAVKLHP